MSDDRPFTLADAQAATEHLRKMNAPSILCAHCGDGFYVVNPELGNLPRFCSWWCEVCEADGYDEAANCAELCASNCGALPFLARLERLPLGPHRAGACTYCGGVPHMLSSVKGVQLSAVDELSVCAPCMWALILRNAPKVAAYLLEAHIVPACFARP